MKSETSLRRAWESQLKQQRDARQRKLENLRIQESNLQAKVNKATTDLLEVQKKILQLENSSEETFESFRQKILIQSQSSKSV